MDDANIYVHFTWITCFPNELVEVAWEGIVLAIFLIIVARPISVMVSTIKCVFL